MNTTHTVIISVLMLLLGFTAYAQMAVLQVYEDGHITTNKYTLITQAEILRSNLILKKTVDSLKLTNKWSCTQLEAVNRLRELLTITNIPSNGTLTITAVSMPEDEMNEIINTVIDNLPANHESVTVQENDAHFNGSNSPQQVGSSFLPKNAIKRSLHVEIMKRAE